MKCPSCGAESAGAFCPVCGTKIKSTSTCTDCGMEFTGRYCPFCGAPANKTTDASQQKTEYQQPNNTWEQPRQQTYQQPHIIINNNQTAVYDKRTKNKWIAFLLCLFLGPAGIHKFYEGRIGMGLLYLFTGGLFGIGVIIDLITLLFKPDYYLQ